MLQLRLETRQTQKIVITPQLRQAIKLLQLSAIELQSYIENEVRENPLLSVEERPDNEGAPEALPEIVASANGEADIPAFDARDSSEIEIATDWEPETPGDRLYEGEPATASAAAEWSSASGSNLPSGDDFDPFATIASSKSLADHLNEQAQLAFTSAYDRLIARYLADLVDIDGYVRSPLEDVAASLSTSL
ncbi:MAG: RNA polymerase sigma-54 factor, partial [Rhodomicrobium sp.]